MAESPDGPSRYHVGYSERVRQEARSLILRARSLGMAEAVVAAIREIDTRLESFRSSGSRFAI